ncbi:hypothetical protein DVH24_031710 [Malus domestica]|uniref:Uncharacterized protein n=1 Tax=Malus domestica TaxID=3750 RepID=A0A498J6D7_MALDO|nr:hypothetical protein DVH24_031710 [Malus domestica]
MARFTTNSLPYKELKSVRGLKESDVDSFVDDVLVNDKPWASGVQEPLTASYVFVCATTNRHKSYRVWTRVLIDKFKEEVELRGLTNQVFIAACFHTGSHNGNLIIYSPGSNGSITGHWYGYVTLDDVPELLDEHIGKGEIIERLWRGQIGASFDEAEKSNGQKLRYGGENKKIEKPQENGNQRWTKRKRECRLEKHWWEFNARKPKGSSSIQGESGPQIKRKGVVDGQQ